MTSDDNAHSDVEEDEDEEYWDRWHLNEYSPKHVRPMKKPLTAPFDFPVSDSDVEKLKAGFRSRNMDDKYDCLVSDENGKISIHIIRHGFQEEEYVLHIAPKSSNDSSASARIHSITWDGELIGINDYVEQAKERAVILARVILKCDLENAPGTI